MNKHRVVLTRRLPERVESLLSHAFDILPNPDDVILSPDQIVERATSFQADALLVTLADRLDAATLARLPDSVRIITTYSVGTNHIDLDAAKARGIAVSYTPDAVTEATADLTLLLILAACRRAHEAQATLRQGRWGAWSAWDGLGTDPGGKVLGLVGMGRIGRAVAKRARAFGMEIHYHQRNRLDADLEQEACYHGTLASLMSVSQILSLHTPSTPQTIGQINAASLAFLPAGAILINTARGDQVVDDAVIAALKSGRLGAAGLDVFAGEPNFDRRYLDLPNAYLLPHVGTSTVETRNQMGMDTITNLTQFFAGKAVPWRIA